MGSVLACVDIPQKPWPPADTGPQEESQGAQFLSRSSLIYSLFYLYVWSRILS